MTREAVDYVEDILDAMSKAIKFVGDMEYEDFIRDDKTVFAVIRAMEVIGEAVKNIPDHVKKRYSEIPWRSMTGMRDKLIHEYFGVELKRVWKTVREEIPPLKPLFDSMLKDLGG